MSYRIEDRRFEAHDPRAREFFALHGYAIVSGVLGEEERLGVSASWRAVVADAAAHIGLQPDEFQRRFPQNRDLWRKSEGFRRLLFDSSQARIAALFLGTSGVRLFHDHAIVKPAVGSGRIPWHQDSAYWPLDRAGISLWTPVGNVGPTGGCLRVLDGSHLDGPCEPQDFLQPESSAHDDDPRLVLLPVRDGETVLLNGLTWHGSAQNEDAVERLAYLTLWVPATARFVPEHAGWHPAAAHISVAAGERLDGDWFPLFGTLASVDEGVPVEFPAPRRGLGPSMFTAGKDIAAQIAWLLGVETRPLAELLTPDAVREIGRRLDALRLVEDPRALTSLLDELALQERVRRESVARDVYLSAVQRWWRLAGARIEEVRGAA